MNSYISENTKIIHITVCRELTEGQRKQLKYECLSSKKIKNSEWTTLAIHSGELKESFEKKIPFYFNFYPFRFFYAWILTLRLSYTYDIVLLRHITFDPFAFIFSSFIPNRISVHHAKEVEELLLIRKGKLGKILSALEKKTGKHAVKKTLGILGVTSEIAKYQQKTRSPEKLSYIYPNGIDIQQIKIATDERETTKVNAVFICGTFAPWHGLDKLIKSINESDLNEKELKIHLIGKISQNQIEEINNLNHKKNIFKIHGFLNIDQYQKIINKADLGIGSLAMERENLKEGATLKVRELLAMGIAVYSNHKDTAIPEEFPFFYKDDDLNINNLLDFGKKIKKTHREDIRIASEKYISKYNAMQNVVDWINEKIISNSKK